MAASRNPNPFSGLFDALFSTRRFDPAPVRKPYTVRIRLTCNQLQDLVAGKPLRFKVPGSISVLLEKK